MLSGVPKCIPAGIAGRAPSAWKPVSRLQPLDPWPLSELGGIFSQKHGYCCCNAVPHEMPAVIQRVLDGSPHGA